MKRKVFLASTLAAAGIASAAQASTNLVVNGDFSQGNVGFTSQYRYVAPTNGSMFPESVYTIASNPESVHPYWVNLAGNKPVMLVNGSTLGPLTVWQQTISTVAGQAYDFSFSAANVCCNAAHLGDYSPSQLELEVSTNGFATFQTLGTILTHPTGDAGRFYTASADLTVSGPVEVRIVDTITQAVGNDFAIGDISVTAVPGQSGPSGSGPGQPGPGGGPGDPGSSHTGPGSGPGVGPTAPVPEPGAWSLMIAGFGALGAAIRSRRGAFGRRLAA